MPAGGVLIVVTHRELAPAGAPAPWESAGAEVAYCGPGEYPAAWNRLATRALDAGLRGVALVDARLLVRPEDLARLLEAGPEFRCGIYPDAEAAGLNCDLRPEALAAGAGPSEVRDAELGFASLPRGLLEVLRDRLKLPRCIDRRGAPLIPFFAPMALEGKGPPVYLDDQQAFCERARRCGFPLRADPALRLRRYGVRTLGCEDVLPAAVADVPPPVPSSKAAAAAAAQRPHPPLPRPPLRPATPVLPDGFPRIRAYALTYPPNAESMALTLDDFRESDWGEDPEVFVQPADWPAGKESSSRNYRRALARAAEDGCDFALVLEDDVRVARHLRHNLNTIPLVRRDQCDYFSLFMPDLVRSPWERSEPHLGYRLARRLYSGPNRLWEKHRIWGSQAYLLSRRFVLAALERWDGLEQGQDARVMNTCNRLQLPLWYPCPGLVEHAPLRTAFGTPAAYAADFDCDFRLEIGPGFQPPEEVPGWLTLAEGRLLWELAQGKTALELGTAGGRSTVCLAQGAAGVLSIDIADQAEAAEWVRRYGLADRVEFRRGDVAAVCAGLDRRFDVLFVDTEHDAASVARDVDAGLPRLRPGGLIAFHDYPDPSWPEVRRTVDALARRHGWQRIAQADYLGAFRT